MILLLLAGCASTPLGDPPPLSPVETTTPQPAPYPGLPAMGQVALTAPPPSTQSTSGSLWRSGPKSLFGDRRAQALGDILTVVISIDEEAEIRNQTDRSRTGSEEMSIANLLGLEASADRLLPPGTSINPGVSTNSSTATAGTGSTRRNEKLTLRVAATVMGVLPNGHLVVSGSQEVRVNFELRDLVVAGVVRPEDINRRNEITYDKIASARIAYGGRGQLTDLQQPRWGQQLLERTLPF
ncbi:MAG: flagellar basal body L-ring protein FlgH [Pseudomonadota bacterium]